jgi:hypothetical protein
MINQGSLPTSHGITVNFYGCVTPGNRHARASCNAHVDQNKVPNHLLVNEPSSSTQGIGGSCGQ